ncbi:MULTISPECIES: DUF6440 family protein [Ruminococcus]|jgi:hypothetical protein|uniref:DUF6440 domain-containing protein n=2 Tax=Ruminococcus albus TaxID=1264 RepID=A0A011V2E5_RUMAL|nr:MULTISPECIES: DUF6440 family protein [Ruminococcus]ADU21545.1 hypothetical protein Rumal_1019 [Ruminococcus albus 7 = DSM 20455]EXM39607.1 hypothetical protein RASY3_07100 [Ruminococcus albus SY3]MBE6867313.1 xylan 1,4-beta-xylosidase [Ruminococcus albus]MCR5022617.1 DUF6440 family protein [Ruminococcus sp.]
MAKKEKVIRFEKVFSQDSGLSSPGFCIFVDKETGVNYIYSYWGETGGLTPLLDKDGKPVITQDGKELL